VWLYCFSFALYLYSRYYATHKSSADVKSEGANSLELWAADRSACKEHHVGMHQLSEVAQQAKAKAGRTSNSSLQKSPGFMGLLSGTNQSTTGSESLE
jgi:hypothetical protein